MDMEIAGILEGIREVIADPTANLTATVFLMAAGVVVILMVLLIVLIVIIPGRRGSGKRGRTARRVHQPAAGSQADAASGSVDGLKRRTRNAGARGATWAVVLLVVSAVIVSYAATSRDSYCMSCHGDMASLQGEASPEELDTAHADVSCVDCHEDKADIVANVMLRGLDVLAQVGLGGSQYGTTVRTARCLRCHDDAIEATLTDAATGVVVSHAEPLAAGWACADCHAGGGHSPMSEAGVMSKCLQCHDEVTASADCATCHLSDPGAAAALSSRRIFGRATITRADCEGCHSMEPCDACHGIRMPHSEEFLKTHPRYSGFDLKDLCYEKCHTKRDCGKCHGSWDSHGPNFEEYHKTLPRGAMCNTCHSQHEGPICDLCHDFDTAGQ